MNTLYARGLGRVARSPGQELTFAPRTNAAWKVVPGKRRVNRTIVSNIPASVAVAHKLCGALRTLRHGSALHTSVRWSHALPRRRRSMDAAWATDVPTDHAILYERRAQRIVANTAVALTPVILKLYRKKGSAHGTLATKRNVNPPD